MAPEINEGKAYTGQAVDVFSSGILLFAMYSGHPPFKKAWMRDYHFSRFNSDKESFWKLHSSNKP